jgi:hypothetical protein
MSLRRLSPICRRLETLTCRARAQFLRWIASGAVIEETDATALEDDDLAALSEAIDRARREGR